MNLMDGRESNSKYEDLHAIAQYMQVDTVLESTFDVFFTEVLQNMALASGKIYSAADLARLKRLKRPHFQKNLFHPILLRLAGDFKGNLPGIRIEGKRRDSYPKSQMMTDINDHILYTANDITYELSKAYITSQQTRLSWLAQDFNYVNDPEGEISIKFYPKLLKFDTSVSDRRFDTCQFIDDSSWYTPEEIIGIYAKKDSSLADEIYEKSKSLFGNDDRSIKLLASWAKRALNLMMDYAGENVGFDETKLAWDKEHTWHSQDGRLKVIDFFERKHFNSITIYDRMQNSKFDVTEMVKLKDAGYNWFDRNKLSYILENHILDPNPHIEEDRDTKIWQTSIVPGIWIKLYEGEQQLKNKNFKFTPVLANDFHMSILETKCLIDVIKDSVKSYNHRDNTNLTYLMRMAIGGHLIEKQYTKDMENTDDNNKIAGFTVVGDGAIKNQGIMERGVPPMNTALVEYQVRQAEEVDKLAGVPLPARGNSQFAGESAKHFMQAVAQGDVMQEWSNENTQASLIQISKNNLWYVQNFYDEERTFKITQNRRNPYWLTINKHLGTEIINDVSQGKFDVIISSKPFGRYAKEFKKMNDIQMIELLNAQNPMLVNPKLIVDLFEPDNYEEWLEWIERVMGTTEQDTNINLLMKFIQMNSGKQDLAGKQLNNAKQNRDFQVENAILGGGGNGMVQV